MTLLAPRLVPLPSVPGRGAPARPLDAAPLPRAALADDRAVPRRPHEGRGRRARPARPLLHRRQQRRRLEDDRLRPHLDADLRRPAHRLDRRHRRRAVESRRDLRRQRRGPAAARPLDRRRHLQVDATAGKTWTHLGLRDGQQIPQIVVDPRDPNRLFVAVLGHPYGPNAERGHLPLDRRRARRFEKVLYKDENTGAVDVALDPSEPGHRLRRALGGAAGAVGERRLQRPGQRPLQVHRRRHDAGGRSTKGLPTFAEGLGRIGITVAPSDPRRLYATVEARRARRALPLRRRRRELAPRSTPTRAWSDRADDFAEVKVDPTNPDVVYVASIVAWKSTDGGKTFTALPRRARRRRLPPHLDQPDDPDVMILSRPTRAPSSP